MTTDATSSSGEGCEGGYGGPGGEITRVRLSNLMLDPHVSLTRLTDVVI